MLGVYLPLLAQVLHAAAPLADCLLVVREGRFDGERTMVRRFRGPELPEPAPVGDDDEELVDAIEESGVVLRLPDGRTLGLSPMLAVTAGPVVGLYDGHYAALTTGADGRPGALRHLVYLGEGNQRWTDEEGFDRLVARLEARQVQWQLDKEKLAPWGVSECVRFRTVEMTLRPLEGVKYFPDCHVERPDLRRWLDGWIAESDDDVAALREGKPPRRIYRSGFVLVGAAGAGKTAWSLHLAARLLGEGVPPEAGEDAARDGRNLVLLLRGDQFPERGERHDRLLPTMLEALGLRDRDYASFGDLLGHLHKKWPEDVRPDRRLVVILDAVNEARAPERLLQEALDLVAAAGAFPWCKVVLTLRRGVPRRRVPAQPRDGGEPLHRRGAVPLPAAGGGGVATGRAGQPGGAAAEAIDRGGGGRLQALRGARLGRSSRLPDAVGGTGGRGAGAAAHATSPVRLPPRVFGQGRRDGGEPSGVVPGVRGCSARGSPCAGARVCRGDRAPGTDEAGGCWRGGGERHRRAVVGGCECGGRGTDRVDAGGGPGTRRPPAAASAGGGRGFVFVFSAC